MNNIFQNLINTLVYYINYIITDCINNIKTLLYNSLGEKMYYELMDRINLIKIFYSELWYRLRYKILNICKDILLEYTWKIKRSNNFIIKILKNYLSKYDWFNNNIIKF